LPFRYDITIQQPNFHLGIGQEYDWKNLTNLQSELYMGLNVKKINFGLGYLFQTRKMQYHRQLLSRIPHFVTLNLSIPFSPQITLSYDGQFYATKSSSLFMIDGIAPLIHRVRLDYDGHCWGMYLGYEEKKYKEYGMGRDERAIVFAFRLDSLGSFAKKFKHTPQPEITIR
jgi:hypothetical protein